MLSGHQVSSVCSNLRNLGLIVIKLLIYTNMSGACLVSPSLSPASTWESQKSELENGRRRFCSVTSGLQPVCLSAVSANHPLTEHSWDNRSVGQVRSLLPWPHCAPASCPLQCPFEDSGHGTPSHPWSGLTDSALLDLRTSVFCCIFKKQLQVHLFRPVFWFLLCDCMVCPPLFFLFCAVDVLR